MAKRAVIPREFPAADEQLKMSPAILTGVTDGDAQG